MRAHHISHIHFLTFTRLASAATALFLAITPTWAASIEGPFGEDLVSKTNTATISGDAYLIQIQKTDEGNQRSVYRLNPEETEFELLTTVDGGVYKRAQEHIFQFEGDLFFTVTRKTDRKIQLYRSTDDGETWEQSGTVGFSRPHFLNEIKAIHKFGGKVFMVIGQSDDGRFSRDSRKQNVGVWSSADGEHWESEKIKGLSGIGEKQKYLDSLVVDDHLFVITEAYDYESEKSIHKQIVVTSTDGNSWNSERVSALEEEADEDHLGLYDYTYTGHSSVGDSLAILFLQYEVTNDTPDDYLHDPVSFGVWTMDTGETTNYESLNDDTSFDNAEFVSLNSGTALVGYIPDTATVNTYQVSEGVDVLSLLGSETLEIETGYKFLTVLDGEHGVGVTFSDEDEMPLLYTTDGETWENVGTYGTGSESDGSNAETFEDLLFVHYLGEQTSVLVDMLTGDISSGFGFEDEMDEDLVDNVEYSFQISPNTQYLFVRGRVDDRSADFSDGRIWYQVPEFCGITTDGVSWDTFTCDYNSSMPHDGFVLDDIWYFNNAKTNSWYAMQPD